MKKEQLLEYLNNEPLMTLIRVKMSISERRKILKNMLEHMRENQFSALAIEEAEAKLAEAAKQKAHLEILLEGTFNLSM